jgi:hypothetical protein
MPLTMTPTLTALSAVDEAHAECARTLAAGPEETVRGLLHLAEAALAKAERLLGFTPGEPGVLNWPGRWARLDETWAAARSRLVETWRLEGWNPRALAWFHGRLAALDHARAATSAAERLYRVVVAIPANEGQLPPDPQ